MPPSGIYVEARIHGELEEIWRKTQDPALHECWDLRFSSITYLPKQEGEPQRFLYQTKIGFGLAICGEGESVGERNSEEERTSALRFWSEDQRSLIAEGNGYWKYIEAGSEVRFFTWYDYKTRYGKVGWGFDRIVFRPLMGWATAWSFDRLRLWIEEGSLPAATMRWTILYAMVRFCVIGIWLWQGLVPKLLFSDGDELRLLTASGLSPQWLPVIGLMEIALGVIGLVGWRWRGYFVATGALMVVATLSVCMTIPAYFHHAFNPLTLNIAVMALCTVGWIAHPFAAFAGRCLRQAPRKDW